MWGSSGTELGEETLLELAAWLKTHPVEAVRGAGIVRLAFQVHPATARPQLEPLLHDVAGRAWLLRWPNGSLKWWTEAMLTDRGFPVPTAALVAEV